MKRHDVLKLCKENGFFLDKEMLDFFINFDEDKVFLIIKKIKELGVIESVLTRNVFDKYKDKLDYFFEQKEGSVDVLRNINGDFGKIETVDFINYFRARFEILRDILIKRGLQNLCSIRRIGLDNGVFSVIGMIYSKRITKNGNLLFEIEDLTGRIIVLVNRDNKELFEQAKQLFLDDVVAFNVSGSSKMLFANGFVYPDGCLDNEKFGDKDEFVAFVSDLHIGSDKFLEDDLVRFVNWLNGEVADSWQKSLSNRVKYLVLVGNNIEGVGIYPGQEKFLKIKRSRGQYNKLAEILGRIRKSVEIIMIPGSHDAVWVGEPMPAIDEKWGGNLNKMDNLKMLSNPCELVINGVKILLYSGGSFNSFINNLGDIGKDKDPLVIANEILKRRHLAPVYADMDIVPSKNGDDLVLKDLPDVFVVGGRNRAMVGNYNNILTISTSCFQGKTNFNAKVGGKTDSCKIPILNLKSKEVKILDFFGEEVVWDKGEDLVCNLRGEKKL